MFDLTKEEEILVNKMEKLGADFSNFFIVTKDNLTAFIKENQSYYNEAAKEVAPTQKQLKIIDKIIFKGVPYNNEIMTSMYHAYEFIKENFHVINNQNKMQSSPYEWGGVLNH